MPHTQFLELAVPQGRWTITTEGKEGRVKGKPG